MTEVAHNPASRQWKKPPFIANTTLRYGLLALVVLYFVAAFMSYEVNWTRVYEGLDRGWEFIKAFSRPDFVTHAEDIFAGIWESIVITVTATVAGVFLAIPVALGAASNLAPKIVYLISRGFIAIARALHEIIVAILMVAIFGFGPFAGFITLTFSTIGFIAKLLAEDIENINKSQAEAVQATGAGWWQWINYAVQPQVMPRLIGLAIYRVDINFRSSSILGLVGAGGVGATLNTAFDRYEFDTAAAIILIIIAIVLVLEYGSSFIRAKVQ
ncbi:MAG: phosphonate ABC transporter, permease protein PhnE [Thiolinea sp.]